MKSLSIKKMLITLLAVFAVFAIFSLTAAAEDYGNFSYTTVEPEEGESFDPYIEISGYSADKETANTVVEIPDAIEDIPVTTISASAFSWKDPLTEVIIPDSITTIENAAFYHCQALTTVVIPDSVTIIGDSAFQDCENLKYVVIGNKVTKIGDIAFKNCSSLEVLSLGSSLSEIGNGAFYNCTSLKDVRIPDSVTSIGSDAFGLTQNGDGSMPVNGFTFYANKSIDALSAYVSGYNVSGESVSAENESSLSQTAFAVNYGAVCDENSHDLKWTNVRVAAEDEYSGLDIARCSKCYAVSVRDNDKLPPVEKDDSAIKTLIIAIVVVIILAVIIFIYVKKSKKRRLQAIEDYKNGKPLQDLAERDAEQAKKDAKYAKKREKQEAKLSSFKDENNQNDEAN